MNNPEQHAPSENGEMGSGHNQYSELSADAAHYYSSPERDRYWALADSARADGENELAKRLEQHANDLDADVELKRTAAEEVDKAWDILREVESAPPGTRRHVTLVFPGNRQSDAVLAAMRKALLSPEGLNQAKIEPVTDPEEPSERAIRYVVRWRPGTTYTETYYEEEGATGIEIEKL
jgi:hypothetical protein